MLYMAFNSTDIILMYARGKNSTNFIVIFFLSIYFSLVFKFYIAGKAELFFFFVNFYAKKL